MNSIDVTLCPICNKKLQVKRLTPEKSNGTCKTPEKHSFYIEYLFKDKSVTYIRFPLNPEGSVYVGIDYDDQETIINDYLDGTNKKTVIARALNPDFPNLIVFKKKIDFYLKLQ